MGVALGEIVGEILAIYVLRTKYYQFRLQYFCVYK